MIKIKRILIVDDSSIARMFVRRCLEIIGLSEATFLEAVNGKEALLLIEPEPVDLLFIDLFMPVMNGNALLKHVKETPGLNKIPVVVITSGNNKAREQELMKLGAYRVVNKPFSPAILFSAIKPLLEPGE